ncbi:hypothetical protein [Paenibacillus taiwanensis]|uniref:hypothetical protein n=1 Tax=Paenibacillus taiwanensis TaxID=401638 RepID=UPI00048D76D9|nr:hypothetical protein [Paenibacillus taiwanensis]
MSVLSDHRSKEAFRDTGHFNVICIVTVAVISGVFVISYFLKKGFLNNETTMGLDKNIADRVNVTLDIADIATDYVRDLADGNKEKLELDAIDKVLNELNITVMEDEQRLIEIIDKEGLSFSK